MSDEDRQRAFGGEIKVYKSNIIPPNELEMCDGDICSWVVTRVGGKSSKVKFDKKEYIRIAQKLLEANHIKEYVSEVTGDSDKTIMKALNKCQRTIIFVLRRSGRAGYKMIPLYGELPETLNIHTT